MSRQSSDRFSRNWAFISPELQTQLEQSTLLVAGTGLGGVVATLAARTGFGGFIVADGDVVERSNLNRQAFYETDLGENKARVIGKRIEAISPAARTRVVPRFLEAADFEELVAAADIVVNTIDWDSPAWVACNLAARNSARPVLFPSNVGWGGLLYVLPHDADASDPRVRLFLEEPGEPLEVKRNIILGALEDRFPPYLEPLLPAFMGTEDVPWPFDPQLGVACHLTAALIVRTAVALVAGEAVKTVPDSIHVDLAEAIRP